MNTLLISRLMGMYEDERASAERYRPMGCMSVCICSTDLAITRVHKGMTHSAQSTYAYNSPLSTQHTVVYVYRLRVTAVTSPTVAYWTALTLQCDQTHVLRTKQFCCFNIMYKEEDENKAESVCTQIITWVPIHS